MSTSHKLNKTDRRLLAAMMEAGIIEQRARELIQRHVYTLTAADMKHMVSLMGAGATQTQAMSEIYQARRIRLARKYLTQPR
ncbi:hypothetical protein OVA10_23830 [Lelliottia sp. SL45]|jgi:hypothetical protein|uniref:Uncharacterized protein n=2 Tax=Lelliottia amnigena TaxID=61646 RepID=A0AAP2F360_LELAM|nr:MULTISPECIES: hypothetical protein [Lelliottia]ELN2579082.1 hypothetical protein [Enterobacter kobei]MBL5937214.1 hypothetical protein [Lelliottia amnigena]MCY1701000.1 hypothetical protein [Lelliottia sp. SL45]MCY1701011.1 hypothetical protein [Lelliottia sp. SL45]MCY1701020.1 hypothetical protein [Lelliottia sp. SL45]